MPKTRSAPQQSVLWLIPAQLLTAVASLGNPLVGKPVHSAPGPHVTAPSGRKLESGAELADASEPPAELAAASPPAAPPTPVPPLPPIADDPPSPFPALPPVIDVPPDPAVALLPPVPVDAAPLSPPDAPKP